MSELPEWKRKALDLWPDLFEYQDDDLQDIYFAFFEILPRCEEAHRAGDEPELARIYDFAEWCLNHEEKDIWNAAAVAFYEHLVDDPIALAEIPRRLKPEVWREVEGLFAFRMNEDEFAQLQQTYRERHLGLPPVPSLPEPAPVSSWDDVAL